MVLSSVVVSLVEIFSGVSLTAAIYQFLGRCEITVSKYLQLAVLQGISGIGGFAVDPPLFRCLSG